MAYSSLLWLVRRLWRLRVATLRPKVISCFASPSDLQEAAKAGGCNECIKTCIYSNKLHPLADLIWTANDSFPCPHELQLSRALSQPRNDQKTRGGVAHLPEDSHHYHINDLHSLFKESTASSLRSPLTLRFASPRSLHHVEPPAYTSALYRYSG